MSRRNAGEDPEFGSDSFLDIIANIVGILIILIVVAGVKVARQPPPASDAVVADSMSAGLAEPEAPSAHVGMIRASSIPEHLQLLRDEAKRESELAAQLKLELSTLKDQSQELVDQMSRLKLEATDLNVQIASYQQQAVRSDAKRSALEGDVAEHRNVVILLQQQSTTAEARHHAVLRDAQLVYDRQEAADSELKQIKGQTQKLRELIEEHQAEGSPEVERLEHRLSPVVRTDSEQELHFRLSGGHISWVPIEPLLERLKGQVSNRAGVISRFGRYEGVCGPVGGYSMKYAVERHTPSPLEGLNGVSTGFRISVSRWTVTPDDSVRAEPVNEALKFGSRFRQIAEAADEDALMTVWLYQGDFVHFRKLREFGHGLGLRVAARPLPDNVEITGSPGGSRSSGQ